MTLSLSEAKAKADDRDHPPSILFPSSFLGSSSAVARRWRQCCQAIRLAAARARHNRFRVGQMCEMADEASAAALPRSFNSIRAKCSVDNAQGSANSGLFDEMNKTWEGIGAFIW